MGNHAITAVVLPGLDADGDRSVRWFSSIGSVRYADARIEVFVGGSLIGSFERGDRGARNVLVVGLSLDPNAHLGRLANAFDIAVESLRLMRRLYESEGLEALMQRAPGGSEAKVTPSRRKALNKLFEQGLSIRAIEEKIGKRFAMRKSTIGRAHQEWMKSRSVDAPASPASEPQTQSALPLDAGVAVATKPTSGGVSDTHVDGASSTPRAADEDKGADATISAIEPRGGRLVQHVGSWMLLALVAKLGLHRAAEEFREERVERDALRVAIDAALIALAIGERCIEGVRRLATSCCGTLLRIARAPSASWVRRVLGRFAREAGSARLHLRMAGGYIDALRSGGNETPVVFYVDNHLRPYTGKQTIRRGWRMQDKRVLPGTTDFYVHDEDGRPVLRVASSSNESLTATLSPVARLLRLALGPEQKILLAFDRGGAFATQISELRNEGFEFVTYERKPYAAVATTAFTTTAQIDGESYGIFESRKNLREGRGRVRRISVLTPEGRQINLLAASEQKPDWLLGVMFGRWVQENGLKHGVERWGINQLDARTTEPYAPDTIIPNPARRRLDRALRIAKVREGDARRELAKLGADDAKRERWESEIAEAIAQQGELEALRPSTPTHAPLKDTELADKLVHHEIDYKLLVDTIRIAGANAEADLAGELAPHLRNPREAKRTLRNLLLAPGRVRVGSRTIAVDLQPAATASEIDALGALCDTVNGWKLTLPGDPKRRALRFRCQK